MKKVITSQASEWLSISSSPACHLLFFSSTVHLLFDSISVARWCWRLSMFLLGASGGDIRNKSPPLEGMTLACHPWKWVVLMQHSCGSDEHIKLRKMKTHSRCTALTVILHEAKESWSILRVNTDPVQAWARLEREERLFHGDNQHSYDHWLLYSW